MHLKLRRILIWLLMKIGLITYCQVLISEGCRLLILLNSKSGWNGLFSSNLTSYQRSNQNPINIFLRSDFGRVFGPIGPISPHLGRLFGHCQIGRTVDQIGTATSGVVLLRETHRPKKNYPKLSPSSAAVIKKHS